MREIRFRGKTLDGLKWVYGDLIQENCGRERVVRGSDLRSGLIYDCGKGCPLRKKEGHENG